MAVPAVTVPVPAALELTFHVTALFGLLVPVTVAVNCSVLPALIVRPDGLTVTLVTEAVTFLTVTVTLPDLEGSNADTAKTKRVCAVSAAATERTPFSSMEVPRVTEPVPAALELTFHVTEVSGSFVPVTTALNRKALPVSTVWFAGLTETPVTVGRMILTDALPDLDESIAEVAVT